MMPRPTRRPYQPQRADLAREPRLVLTTDEAAAYLRISRETCWRLMASGELKSLKTGKLRFTRPADIEAYLAAAVEQEAATHDPRLARQLLRHRAN